MLARKGYFQVNELATFRKINTRLQGHPSIDHHLPGIRMASGSLGQGLSVGMGCATAARLDGSDRRAFVMIGDGEMQEGSVWEAAMAAAHHELGNLNRLQWSSN